MLLYADDTSDNVAVKRMINMSEKAFINFIFLKRLYQLKGFLNIVYIIKKLL